MRDPPLAWLSSESNWRAAIADFVPKVDLATGAVETSASIPDPKAAAKAGRHAEQRNKHALFQASPQRVLYSLGNDTRRLLERSYGGHSFATCPRPKPKRASRGQARSRPLRWPRPRSRCRPARCTCS